MPLTPAKCTNCGGSLSVDSSLEAAVCPYCKTPYIVEKAINNYNTTVVHQYGKGAVVNNIVTGESLAELSENAKTMVQIGDYNNAFNFYKKITEHYPKECMGWWGLLLCITNNFQATDPYLKYANTLDVYYKNFSQLCMDDAVKKTNERIFKKYLRNVARYSAANLLGEIEDKKKITEQ